ncbi:secreted ookinete protein, putative [Plasmodium malariae]|uniref:Secreted ookinete protein, putative n=1 Tax=Plasmodium malariae TaxID=5858 RepID=A0A1A8VTG1_PLAMA|nr:secreted ookinete protein, putative [Plasmodium malariae]SBS82104.1 secreted ookinete protein, putative (PSOP1) [Plasmodium malariae]SBT86325.1 secreted ookinete protein, putative [Plasmodium malariae]
MNKLFVLFLFLYVVAAVRPIKEQYREISNTLNNNLKKRNTNTGKPFNLKESIAYERKNNYELYIDTNGELKQQRNSVNEPRQLLKKKMENFRYLINDLEIHFGVYKFNSYDKDKVLRETLKPESLCFTILGLLTDTLNKITINDSPIYGFIIKGEKNENNEVNSTLGIYVILSNVTVPLGDFYFPKMKNAPYEIPFLVGYYDSRRGYRNKKFSYLCPLPPFLVDVIRTTKFGLKVKFNSLDLDVNEFYPATLSHALENKDLLPVQKSDSFKEERNKMINLLANVAKDVPYRSIINDSHVMGVGFIKPEERIWATKSFSTIKEQIKQFLSSSGRTPMDNEAVAIYFLSLSQRLHININGTKSNKITKIQVSNVQKNNAGVLEKYTIKLDFENSASTTTNAVVKGKNIFIPKSLNNIQATITYEIPPTFGLAVGQGGQGVTYTFAELTFPLSNLFPYNVNNLSSFVKNI